jgi:phosphoribosylglycinamide formyltransferase-1
MVFEAMKLAVFASGGGSNFGAILDARAEGRLGAEIVLLVTDRPGIGAITRAETEGIPYVVIHPGQFPLRRSALSVLFQEGPQDKHFVSESTNDGIVVPGGHEVVVSVSPPLPLDEATFGQALLEALDAHGADFIALAGYLKKIPAVVVDRFRHRMLNIHPALLPAFGGHGLYGRRVHEAVITYGAKVSGATVHLVDTEYDTGPVVLQESVPVQDDDTPEALAARVLELEHRLFPEALRLFAEGHVAVEGRRVLRLARS